MLTIELLRQNSALTGLTETQLEAIQEMSRNDENTVLGAKIGALHGQYDTDILEATKIAKNQGEKSYDYLKRVLGEYKSQIAGASTWQKQLQEAQAEVARLTKKIEDGEGDTALRQQLKDAKNQVSQLQAQLQTKETELTTAKETYDKQVKGVHIDYLFGQAVSGLKFKAGIPESVQKVLLESAKAEILAKGTPDFIDNEKGGKTLILRDVNGVILNNPQNNLNPYTIQELVMTTSLKDAIDTGKQQPGGGTKPVTTVTTKTGAFIDFSGARTQVEADKLIEAHLLANGITRDSAEFAEQSLALRNENNISELPLR